MPKPDANPIPPLNPADSRGPLRSKYGGKLHEALNRAVRAECPGGGLALDRINDAHKICQRLGWGENTTPATEPVHVTAYRWLIEIADEMEASVRARYGLDPAPEREDLQRGRS